MLDYRKIMKTLIAFFSHAGENYFDGALRHIEKGNTAVVAEKVQTLTGGDLVEIRRVEPYPDGYRDCVDVARAEKAEDARPAIEPTVESIEPYDIIYVGFPNWCGTMPMPVFSFLEQFDWQGKYIVPFCTHEGGGLGRSVDDILRVAAGVQTLEGIAFKGTDVELVDKKIIKWVDRTNRPQKR